jgi:hypothetical protein
LRPVRVRKVRAIATSGTEVPPPAGAHVREFPRDSPANANAREYRVRRARGALAIVHDEPFIVLVEDRNGLVERMNALKERVN